MVVEEFVNFWDWIVPATVSFLIIAAVLIVVGTLFGYMVAAARYGPSEAFYIVSLVIAQSGPDFFRISPRRVTAIARLAIQEAIRRRVLLVAFAIFSSLLLVGGWFLDVRSDDPERIYVSFVLFGTQLLVLMLVLLISAFSLPQDIKNRTIFTVVTKPVRACEIVLGRVLGFGLMGTVLLIVMGSISYLFILRGLSHSHEIDPASFTRIDPDASLVDTGRRTPIDAEFEGETSTDNHHRHRVWKMKDGSIQVEQVMGHIHNVTVDGEGSSATYTVSSPVGFMRARNPIYAKQLRFLDRHGNVSQKGVNVGYEWGYRSYIDGGASLARAIFQFEGLSADQFEEDIIPLAMKLSVYRTHKGNIEQRVTGTLVLKSTHQTESGAPIEYESKPIIFESKEFEIDTIGIPRNLEVTVKDIAGNTQTRKMDLFDEFAADGEFEIWLRCNESSQYFGVAQADLFFQAKEGWFVTNFFKTYVSVWLQMLIVVSLGVMFSTFLSGPVSMFGTFAVILFGFAGKFIRDIASGEMEGGGMLEATYRVIAQESMTIELEDTIGLAIIQAIDSVLMNLLSVVTRAVPDLFQFFKTSDYLAEGFRIDNHLLGTHIALALSCSLVLLIIGYFNLKTREIAA